MAGSSTRAGALDRPIQIQEAAEAQDPNTGEMIPAWTRVANEWASVESVDSAENYVADRTLGHKLRYFTIRAVSWITVKHRIVYDGDNFDILSIADVEARGRNHFMRLLCEVKK